MRLAEYKQYWANIKFVSAVSIILDILNLLIKYKFFVIISIYLQVKISLNKNQFKKSSPNTKWLIIP